ncbi:hypothetical protein [Burkholderia sp. 3C]
MTRPFSLLDLIEQLATPDAAISVEHAADAYLTQYRYGEALSLYYELDALDPRIAAKIAYCEWKENRYDDARRRLSEIGLDLDTDGVALLCELIRTDYNFQRQQRDMEANWSRLRELTTADSVPLIAAIARCAVWWPGDFHSPEQRRQDIEHMLALHPDNKDLRLAALSGMREANAPLADQYALLNAVSGDGMPRYQWELANAAASVGRFDEAMSLLDAIEKLERDSAQPSTQLLFFIDLLHTDIESKKTNTYPASRFEALCDRQAHDGEKRAMVLRVALAAACDFDNDRVGELTEKFLDALEKSDYGFTISEADLSNPFKPVIGYQWDTHGRTGISGKLMPYRDMLIAKSAGRSNLYFRAAFAASDIYSKISDTEVQDLPKYPFWDKLAELVINHQDNELEFDGKYLSLYTGIRANRQRPNWTAIGQDWIRSESLAAQAGQYDTEGWITLKAAQKTATSFRLFSTSIIKWLRDNPIPAPRAYDTVHELISLLAKAELHRERYQLTASVATHDSRPEVRFSLGLSAHLANDAVTAKKVYAELLAKNPDDYSPLFNSILLCQTTSDLPYLAKLREMVENFPETSFDEKQKLEEQLAKAEARCEDKEIARQRMLDQELSNYPSLIEGEVLPEDLTLRAAVALLALLRCANGEPSDTELVSIEKGAIPFNPKGSSRSILFELLETGLVAVHPKTSTDAFVYEDGKVSAWKFSNIYWQLSPACETLIENLRSLNGEIPPSWRSQIRNLALEIARGEIVEYLNFLASERGWPPPKNTEDLSDLTRSLANERTVAESYYLAYLGAMSASDYKQKYPVNAQQAADMLVKRTGQRLETLRAGNLQPKVYGRRWQLPRSALSLSLWETILNSGDRGFTHPLSELDTNL